MPWKANETQVIWNDCDKSFGMTVKTKRNNKKQFKGNVQENKQSNIYVNKHK